MVENRVEDPAERTPEDAATQAPFDDAPHDPAALQGCSRPVLFGCGATVLLGALLFLLLISNAKELFVWAFNINAQQILESLPDEVTADEEERLRRALDAASAAIIEGRIDLGALQDLQRALALASRPSLTRDDVLEAIEALERVAATPAPGGEAAPERGPPIAAVSA